MAVDYIHRLVVTGVRGTVDLLRQQLRRTAVRSVAEQTWREMIPFSFKRLYEFAPKAVRIDPNVPCDPFDISVWQIQRLPKGLAEVRYQLHTRNMELFPFVRVLSKSFPTLEFRVVTHCMDDNEIASYRLCDGTVRKWIVPKARRKAHWQLARQKFGLAGDEVYDDDEATYFAEEGMREEALDHWEHIKNGPRRPPRRARSWRNRPVSRDLDSERLIAIIEISEQRRAGESLDASSAAGTSRKPRFN